MVFSSSYERSYFLTLVVKFDHIISLSSIVEG